MLAASQVFSSETLVAGVDTLREQGVKVENSPDRAAMEAELKDTN